MFTSKLASLRNSTRGLNRLPLRRHFGSSLAQFSSAGSDLRLPLDDFTETELQIRDLARQFANERILPKIDEMEQKGEISQELINETFELGLCGIEIPEKYGGSELNFMNNILAIEEISKIDSSTAALVDVQNTLFNRTILLEGSEAQKEKWLPKLATDTLGSFCLSEASCGSDAFALKCRADDKGDHYVLNGQKNWITNSKEAGVYIVLATVDPSKGYKGITAFIVERSNPGITIGKPENKVGLKASSTCAVFLDNCIVPKEDVLGEVGKGYKLAIGTLNEGRIAIASQLLGLAEGAYDYAMPYLRERKAFGRYIGDFQGLEFEYAQAAMEIHAARVMTYQAARMYEQGRPVAKEAAMAKLYASQVANKVSTQCVQWMGGVGVINENRAQKYFRDWIPGSIYEGSSQILKETIAKLVKRDVSEGRRVWD
uniref:short-chain 2-methylacyl-CoA dehydrogenase n=1 Tax=Percolomonas cosmopolitus TaxID=63605 RepID=A0A7S1KT05_9EUKA